VASAIQWQEIPLAQILPSEEAAAAAGTAPEMDRLVASLREVGLLNPIWVRPRPGEGRYQVITGSRRLEAAARLGWQEIPARPAPAGASDFFCLLVHLVDNAYSRGFNLREQAALAARLLEHCDRETVAARYLPYLGLPPSRAHLERLLKAAGLEAPWQQLAALGRLSLGAAARLAEWDPEGRAAARPFLEGLSLSQSKQEEFLDQVGLLARREGVLASAVLSRDELCRALAEPDRTPQERTAVVRQHLYRWVYPRLSAARQAFERTLARLGLTGTPRLRLTPPVAFEGPDYHLEIKFRDATELQHLLAEIARLTRQEEFADLTRG